MRKWCYYVCVVTFWTTKLAHHSMATLLILRMFYKPENQLPSLTVIYQFGSDIVNDSHSFQPQVFLFALTLPFNF